MSENHGDLFQQNSKYKRGRLPRHYLDWENKPPTYKKYNKEEIILSKKLPSPEFNMINFWEVIVKRHSSRKFGKEALSLEQLSLLLFGMSGLTRISPDFAYRTTPSAGGLFPIEIYPVINNAEGLDSGIYHYNIQDHLLEYLKEGDFRKEISEGCLNQTMAYISAVNFIWTAIIERSKWKYLQRCYRYIYLDAGHIGQNFYLVAQALGLNACTIGAIYDDELNSLLNLDGINETAIYVGVIGKPYK